QTAIARSGPIPAGSPRVSAIGRNIATCVSILFSFENLPPCCIYVVSTNQAQLRLCQLPSIIAPLEQVPVGVQRLRYWGGQVVPAPSSLAILDHHRPFGLMHHDA